jgi:hypothetical protein
VLSFAKQARRSMRDRLGTRDGVPRRCESDAHQARWDSVIVARVLLMGFAVVALAAALARLAQ